MQLDAQNMRRIENIRSDTEQALIGAIRTLWHGDLTAKQQFDQRELRDACLAILALPKPATREEGRVYFQQLSKIMKSGGVGPLTLAPLSH
jgi:hypothetical protein